MDVKFPFHLTRRQAVFISDLMSEAMVRFEEEAESATNEQDYQAFMAESNAAEELWRLFGKLREL